MGPLGHKAVHGALKVVGMRTPRKRSKVGGRKAMRLYEQCEPPIGAEKPNEGQGFFLCDLCATPVLCDVTKNTGRVKGPRMSQHRNKPSCRHAQARKAGEDPAAPAPSPACAAEVAVPPSKTLRAFCVIKPGSRVLWNAKDPVNEHAHRAVARWAIERNLPMSILAGGLHVTEALLCALRSPYRACSRASMTRWVKDECTLAVHELRGLLAGKEVSLSWDHWDKAVVFGSNAKQFLGLVARLVDAGYPMDVFCSFTAQLVGVGGHKATRDLVVGQMHILGVPETKITWATTDNHDHETSNPNVGACVAHGSRLAVGRQQ